MTGSSVLWQFDIPRLSRLSVTGAHMRVEKALPLRPDSPPGYWKEHKPSAHAYLLRVLDDSCGCCQLRVYARALAGLSRPCLVGRYTAAIGQSAGLRRLLRCKLQARCPCCRTYSCDSLLVQRDSPAWESASPCIGQWSLQKDC